MGLPMAGHLLEKGHDLTVWNRTIEKARGIGRKGARIADNPAQLAALCDEVFLCVTGDDEVRWCVGAMLGNLKPDALVVDHSTTSPECARELGRTLAGTGHRFVDAPVTGGSMGAQAGTLTAFCGGSPEDIEQAAPAMGAYCSRVERVGGPGAGQLLKIANQIAVGGALLGLCESLAFCKSAGLDLDQAHRLIGSGAAASWAFQNYGPKILQHDWSPGFSVRNQRKDFGYALAEAGRLGAEVPGTALVDSLLSQLETEGRGAEATAALYDVLVGPTGKA
jgi:3-hydroxyisobutyrate dehydrogenase-like beta-hydroxyacid dehydrogenase